VYKQKSRERELSPEGHQTPGSETPSSEESQSLGPTVPTSKTPLEVIISMMALQAENVRKHYGIQFLLQYYFLLYTYIYT
jgi:hypothetical protein